MNGVILLASEGLPTMAHVNRLTKRITYFAGAIGVIGLIQFFLRIDPFSYLRFPGLSLNNEIASLGARGNNTLLRVKAGTLHPIEFSVVMGIALPLALHHLIHEPDRSLRWRRASLTGVIAATSLLAVSRTAVIVTAAAAIVMFWAWSPKFRLKALGFALGFLVLLRAVIPGLLGTLFFLFDNLSEDDSVTGRTDDYAIVAPLIAERPWFGRGTGTFLPEENILLDNGYLYRIITTGYVGLLTLLVLTFTALFMARHAARRHPDNRVRHLAMATAALIFAGSLSGGTFDLYAFPTANGLLSLGIGLAAGLGRMHPPISSVPGPVPRGLLQPKYRAGHVDRPWWYRFDPELRKRGGW